MHCNLTFTPSMSIKSKILNNRINTDCKRAISFDIKYSNAIFNGALNMHKVIISTSNFVKLIIADGSVINYFHVCNTSGYIKSGLSVLKKLHNVLFNFYH